MDRLFEACGIAALLNMDGKPVPGKQVADMIRLQKERENGLGAGFAAYGIFPKHEDDYCIQVLLEEVPGTEPTRNRVEEYLNEATYVAHDEEVPTQETDGIVNPPQVWRFFVNTKRPDPDEHIKEVVMHINANIDGAFCMSSGKNMGVFKGNGWAADIAEFYKIDDMKAYMWSAHSRFPTNTPGWWGGAHPFNLLGTSVVHNGEITSYGTNVNYLEERGYKCMLRTDTEVLAYIFDYIVRCSGYPKTIAHQIATTAMAPPYWRDINNMDTKRRRWMTHIRQTYKSALANGPFSIVVTTDNPEPTMIVHTDRKKLRPLIAAYEEGRNMFYAASELSSIRTATDTRDYWQPNPGVPVIASLKGIKSRGQGAPLDEVSLL
ncbi:MAG: glutamine amidotransferase family protein [Candidatus Altiarchaeota archaeon]